MKSRPLASLGLVLLSLFVANPEHGGLLGHWLSAGLGATVGSYGSFLVIVGLVVAGLALSGLLRTLWLILRYVATVVRKAVKALSKQLWLRQVRLTPRFVPRPLVTAPVFRETFSRYPLEMERQANEDLPPHPWRTKAMGAAHREVFDTCATVESEVRGGLASLGYSKMEIERTIRSLDLRFLTTEKALRQGISLLRKAK